MRTTAWRDGHPAGLIRIPRRAAWAALVLALGLTGCTALPPPAPLAPPSIISAADWGGTPAALPATPQPVQWITLHHGGVLWPADKDVRAYLPRLQQWSRRDKGWADVPYHYIIAPDGRLYAGRPEALAGDTNTEYDTHGHLQVMVLGNFEEQQPNRAQLAAAAELMAWLAHRHGLDASRVGTHKDHSHQTVCPGAHLDAQVRNGWLGRAVAARLAGRPLPEPVLQP